MNSIEPASVTERTGLTDLVLGLTRGPNCLDHILVSDVSCYGQVKIANSVVKNDHKAIVAYNGQPIANPNKTRAVRQFRHRSPAANADYLNYLAILEDIFFDFDPSYTPQAAFDKFYKVVSSLLERFYPERSVTIILSDPEFMTPEIKAALRNKNKLMHQGRVEEANALALKIGPLIMRHNAGKLRQLDASDGARAVWEKVREVTGRTAKTVTPLGVTASSLNTHYAGISTHNEYVAPTCKPIWHTAHSDLSEYQIFNILDKLKPTATGLDHLPSYDFRLQY